MSVVISIVIWSILIRCRKEYYVSFLAQIVRDAAFSIIIAMFDFWLFPIRRLPAL